MIAPFDLLFITLVHTWVGLVLSWPAGGAAAVVVIAAVVVVVVDFDVVALLVVVVALAVVVAGCDSDVDWFCEGWNRSSSFLLKIFLVILFHLDHGMM